MKIYAMYCHDRPLPDDQICISFAEFDQLVKEREFFRNSLHDIISDLERVNDKIVAVYSYCHRNNISFPDQAMLECLSSTDF